MKNDYSVHFSKNAFVDTFSIARTLDSADKAKQFIDDLEHCVIEKLLQQPYLAKRYRDAWCMAFDGYSLVFDINHYSRVIQVLFIAKSGLK